VLVKEERESERSGSYGYHANKMRQCNSSLFEFYGSSGNEGEAGKKEEEESWSRDKHAWAK